MSAKQQPQLPGAVTILCKNCKYPRDLDCRCPECMVREPEVNKAIALCHVCLTMYRVAFSQIGLRAAQEDWLLEQKKKRSMIRGENPPPPSRRDNDAT